MNSEHSLSPAEVEKLPESSDEIGRQLWEDAKSQNFTGPAADLLMVRLHMYAQTRLRGMIVSGRIFARLAKRGRLVPQDTNFPPTPHDVEDLVTETLLLAVTKLLEPARKGAGWDPDRGAQLTTYFIGICVGEFSNVYRKWFDSRSRTGIPTDEIEPLCDRAIRADSTAESALAADDALDAVDRNCPDATIRERKVLFLIARGHDLRDVAERLGLTYRAVESSIHRLRRRYGRNSRGGTNER